MDTVAKNWFCPVSQGKSRNYPLPSFQYLSNISINTVEKCIIPDLPNASALAFQLIHTGVIIFKNSFQKFQPNCQYLKFDIVCYTVH